jgi:hypothetical protein
MMRKRKSPLLEAEVNEPRGLFRRLAEEASTFQKFAAAITAGITLVVLLAVTITKYAPWAWASEVIVMNTKVDLLTTIVLQGRIEDTERTIASLEIKRGKVGLTNDEAEYLRANRRRLEELKGQLQAIGKK